MRGLLLHLERDELSADHVHYLYLFWNAALQLSDWFGLLLLRWAELAFHSQAYLPLFYNFFCKNKSRAKGEKSPVLRTTKKQAFSSQHKKNR